MTLPKVYAATKYGWGVVYCVTIEGIATVFTERELGLTLPGAAPFADYTAEDGSLVVDDSGPVGSDLDRTQGVGVGLSFGFALLDTSAVRTALLAPSYTARLTAAVTAAATTIAVDDTTGWASAGQFWLGVERVEYTGTTATSFTGCTRGTAGKAYAHSLGSASSIVTDKPRWYIGREITLWAYAVDPIGQVPGSTFGDEENIVCVWRGYIEEGPQRTPHGFRFEASALDRRLARPLQALASGTVANTTARHTIAPSEVVGLTVRLLNASNVEQWSHTITWSPFSALSAASLYSGAQLRSLVVSTFATALAAAGSPATTRIELIKWITDPTSPERYRLAVEIKSSALTVGYFAEAALVLASSSYWTAAPSWQNRVNTTSGNLTIPPSSTADQLLPTYDNPLRPIGTPGASVAGITGLAIKLDEGDPANVTAPVTVDLQAQDGGASVRLVAGKVSSVQGLLYVGGFTSISGPGIPKADVVGSSAAVLYAMQGSIKTAILEHLHSSGTENLRDSTYDKLQRAQGYGLLTSRVNQPSFSDLDGIISITLDTTTGARSLVDIFAGLLALTQYAIVARVDVTDDYRQIKLTLVRTALGSSGGEVSITDADLLALTQSPVEVLDRARPINLIKLALDGGADVTFSDPAAAETFGTVEQTWKVPHNVRDQVHSLATPLVAAYLATQPTIQVFRLRVACNVDAHVGDSVELSLTHPAIYDWQSGTQGFTGPAVVLGRSFDLRTMAVSLTVAASAMIKTSALSPAALVTAYSGATSITLARGWYTHMKQTLDASGGSFRLVVYDPGSVEDPTNYLDIDAVTDTGAACLLGIQTEGGSLTPTANQSYVTLPETGNADAFQKKFAHVGDGGAFI